MKIPRSYEHAHCCQTEWDTTAVGLRGVFPEQITGSKDYGLQYDYRSQRGLLGEASDNGIRFSDASHSEPDERGCQISETEKEDGDHPQPQGVGPRKFNRRE